MTCPNPPLNRPTSVSEKSTIRSVILDGHHNVSGEYKKGDRHQAEGIYSAENFDYDQRKRIVEEPNEDKRRNANRKIDWKPENDQHNEQKNNRATYPTG